MTYTVVWDDPNIQVRVIIASREEFRLLLEALANAEKHLPAVGGQAADPPSQRHSAGEPPVDLLARWRTFLRAKDGTLSEDMKGLATDTIATLEKTNAN